MGLPNSILVGRGQRGLPAFKGNIFRILNKVWKCFLAGGGGGGLQLLENGSVLTRSLFKGRVHRILETHNCEVWRGEGGRWDHCPLKNIFCNIHRILDRHRKRLSKLMAALVQKVS